MVQQQPLSAACSTAPSSCAQSARAAVHHLLHAAALATCLRNSSGNAEAVGWNTTVFTDLASQQDEEDCLAAIAAHVWCTPG